MTWNEHWELKGKHALFSASKYNWINYDVENMLDKYCSNYATTIGSILHEFAADRILYLMKMGKGDKKNLKFELLRNNIPPFVVDSTDLDRICDIMTAYVNDAVGFHMTPEQILFYSPNFFGTADAISFRDKKLKIFDFKSGETPAHMEQLMIYAALFCLEYSKHPTDIDMELRLYQSPEVLIIEPSASDIVPIMDKIITFDKHLNSLEV